MKAAQNAIAEKKGELLAPTRELQQTAREWFGPMEKAIVETQTFVKAQLAGFIDKAVKESSQVTKDAIANGDMALVLANMSPVPHVEGISLRTDIDVEIVDLDQVPREFLRVELDLTKIKKAVKNNVHIPGLVCSRKLSIAVSGNTGDE